MSFGHALYYPHIDLTNKNWLKHAFLFWDKISRIVPSSVVPSDNEDVIKIRSETGFIEDYAPESWVVSDAFHSFSRFLEGYIQSGAFHRPFRRSFPNDYSEDRYRERQLGYRDGPDSRRAFSQAVARSQGTYLHINKLDPRLKERLFELGLAVPGESQWEDWVRIDNEFGFIYRPTWRTSFQRDNHFLL